MRESSLQEKCIEFLKEQGIYHVNIHGGGWSGKGSPDIISCIDGMFVAFELKVDDNHMQPDQRIHKRRIVKSGGWHFCPRSLQEFKVIINKLRGTSE